MVDGRPGWSSAAPSGMMWPPRLMSLLVHPASTELAENRLEPDRPARWVGSVALSWSGCVMRSRQARL